jgi:hypothetical protein
MQKKGEHLGKYVLKVQEESRQFAQDLLTENDKLRGVAASLESETLRLQEQVLLLQKELDYNKLERLKLQRQLMDIEAQSKRFSERYAAVEQQSANLANLYVASYRLHGTLNRQEVLHVIEEIIVNMIGSEELAVFEVDEGGSSLSLISSLGLEGDALTSIPIGSGLIGQVARTGEPYLPGSPNGHRRLPHEADLTACIALKLDNRVTGAIAVFRLLSQKSGLEDLDHELFDLLATHAATALYCTRVQAVAV